MRGLLWLMLGLLSVFATSPASAQWVDTRYPVCMEVFGSRGARNECVYWSAEQCVASADGIEAMCFPNPFYAPLALAARPIQPRRLRHYY